jgi:hypothetical protein
MKQQFRLGDRRKMLVLIPASLDFLQESPFSINHAQSLPIWTRLGHAVSQ